MDSMMRIRTTFRAFLLLAVAVPGAFAATADSAIKPPDKDGRPLDLPPPADLVKFAGLSPEDAAREASVPPGFKLHLFAGEPDVKQPIAFTIDERGRLWVAEG